MQDLNIALIQFEITWQNPASNRAYLEKKINNLDTKTDLIVLPEMFTTGFTMDVENNKEGTDGESIRWMQKMAVSNNVVLTGSLIIKEGNKYYNRLFWVEPNGNIGRYDKRHLFRMADENNFFSQGNELPIFKVNGWNVRPLICYDLRFPVWARNTNLAYDLVLYIANWPMPRIEAWNTLLKARAIENLSYAAGLNRIGQDGLGKYYNGHSAVYNFKGAILNKLTEEEDVVRVTLSKTQLENYRSSFPTNLDADIFNIQTK